jgi:hypothetical protein
MRYSIEENAADSLRRSVAYFAERTQSGLKAAVKELISALELYVKVQLVRLDRDPSNPVLVYERFTVSLADNPRRYELKPSGPATVRFDQALERLAWLGHEIAPTDAAQIRQLKRIRNTLEHFSVEQEDPSVRTLYAAVIGFVIGYLHVYLSCSFFDVVDSVSWQAALAAEPSLRRVATLSAKEIYQNLVAAADRAIGVSECAQCGADVMIPSSGYFSGYRCVVCGFVHEVEECYSCKKAFYLPTLDPHEGDTALCTACLAGA